MGHSTKPVPREVLEGLRDFATAKERECLDALIAHGSYRKAARALGKNDGSFISCLRTVRKRAASRGYSPPHDWRKPVPEGHRVKGNSTLYGQDGSVAQQWVKSERDTEPEAHAPVPPDHVVTGTATYVDAQGQVRGQWTTTRKGAADQWSAFERACREHAENYRGLAEKIDAPEWSDDSTCSVYPLGDPHVGMLAWGQETGEDFDLRIAERDLKAVLTMLVAQAPASSLAVLANVGDFFHAEDDRQLTPGHGHKLDVDSRAAKVFRLGCTLMRSLIDLLLSKHREVRVFNVPGNHDPMTSRMLALWLEAVYEREPRVTIEPNLNPFAYFTFGRNLFGLCHGDGCKPADLPAVMAADRPEEWGATDHRYWLTGHVHHSGRSSLELRVAGKEFRACSVEHFRTLAARDYWHHSKGYRSGRSLSRITYHRQWGEISRGTVDLRLARASMKEEGQT